MKKTKFKCESCNVTVKRPAAKIVESRGLKYCSNKCKDQENAKGN